VSAGAKPGQFEQSRWKTAFCLRFRNKIATSCLGHRLIFADFGAGIGQYLDKGACCVFVRV